MDHLKAVGEEPEPTEGKSIMEGDKDDEGEPTGTPVLLTRALRKTLIGGPNPQILW